MTISLKPITRDNLRAVIRLNVAASQQHFVANNAFSIAQAYVEPGFVPLAIYNDDEPVGFLMHGRADEDQRDWILRLMIDAKQQGKGYGQAAMEQVIVRLSAQPDCHEIMISYEPDNDVARRLYASLGFAETGEIEEGEIIARLGVKR